MTAPSPLPPQAPPRAAQPPTLAPPAWRAMALGALLIPPAALFGVYSYTIVQAILWSQQSLKCGPIFVLFLLTLANMGLRRIHRRLALTQAELIVVYSMLV